MFYCWGQQHHDNGLAVAVSDLPLVEFLAGWFGESKVQKEVEKEVMYI